MLAIVLAGQFMAVLDASVVNVAAPSIHNGLHASGAGLQLVIAGYTITYAVLLVTGARLGDLLGHRRIFLAGLTVFTLASLGCGLAGSTGLLVGMRFVQGAGAAAMIPQVLSLIQRTFTGAARARAMSAYAAVLAGGVVVGQIAGGVLISANLFGSSWRPVFAVNVPIGAVLLLAGWRRLPAGRGEAGRGLDLPGVLTLSPAVLALVVPLVLGQPEHWPAWGWACLAASAVLFAGFAVTEARLARRGGSPLIPGRVLRLPGVAMGIGALFAAMTVFGGLFFVAGAAPAGRAGRLAAAGRPDLRAVRRGVRDREPELAAAARPAPSLAGHLRFRRRGAGPAGARCRAARRRAPAVPRCTSGWRCSARPWRPRSAR